MMRYLLVLLVGLSVNMSSAASPLAAQGGVEVVSAEFGVFDASDPLEVVFEQTQLVPHRPEQRYGWVIEVRTGKRSLAVREEYLLPLKNPAPKALDSSGSVLDIPLERRSQVSHRQLVPVDGKIYGEWAIGPGEPPGHRHLQVVIENQVAASFEFEVR